MKDETMRTATTTTMMIMVVHGSNKWASLAPLFIIKLNLCSNYRAIRPSLISEKIYYQIILFLSHSLPLSLSRIPLSAAVHGHSCHASSSHDRRCPFFPYVEIFYWCAELAAGEDNHSAILGYFSLPNHCM